jgi:hypothetical protein
MNEIQDKDEYVDFVENALDSTPVEVRRFLFSDTYAGIIKGFQKFFSLTDEQTTKLEQIISDSFLGLESEQGVSDRIKDLKFDDEKRDKIILYIQEYILNPVLLAISDAVPSETEGGAVMAKDAEPVSAPSPSDMIARLNQTLKQPTTIAPVRRDYSLDKTDMASNTPKPSDSSTKTIDPYRELPN